jgi:hypothetical protein
MRRKEGAGKMTDAQFEKIKKGLIFHSENGVDNLCTLTETALRELLDEASKDKVVEHFEAYGQCRDSRRIAELEAQIEKMKCCENCKYNSYWGNELHCNYGLKEALQEDKLVECKNMDKWEIKEK